MEREENSKPPVGFPFPKKVLMSAQGRQFIFKTPQRDNPEKFHMIRGHISPIA
jgi:hypothetical protein